MTIEIEYTIPIDDVELRQLGGKHYMCCDVFVFDVGAYHKDRIDIIIGLLVRDYIPENAVVERITVDNS